jgi:hypothetical protein
MLFKSKADFIGSLRPEAYDVLPPHSHFINDHMIELFVADALRITAAGYCR